jgi:cobalt-zinc-cadmium efflux system membrane fusion protein
MNFLVSGLHTVLLAVLLMAGAAAAHEGHDHADDFKAMPQLAGSPRLEATSGPFELVALLRQGELAIYLDEVETNAPITNASVVVETPAGSIKAEAQEGIYRLGAPWAQAGSHSLIFAVTEGNRIEILSGTLTITPRAAEQNPGWSLRPFAGAGAPSLLIAIVAFAGGGAAMLWTRRRKAASLALFAALLFAGVPDETSAHEGHDHASEPTVLQPSSDIAQRLSDGTLFVPKPAQRILAIRTALTQSSIHARTLDLPGRIIPDPDASGFVQASVSGRLSPPESGFPKLGTQVKAGDVLALVTPPFQAIDVSDMRQKAGELDQQIDIVARRVARYEPLAKNGVVNKVALDDAVAELKGLRERRASLDKTRGEPERLIAPVSGVIAASNAVSGQIAETNAIVFQIVDPARLWVEALTFTLVPDDQPATALTGEGRKLALSFQGAGLTDRSQAIPVHFAIEGNEKGLRVGQLVTVLAATGEKLQGLALPRTSVLRASNGQTIIFEHTAAERFAPRMVRVQPLDADRVLVLDGIAAGKRVVVQGAELLNQIR